MTSIFRPLGFALLTCALLSPPVLGDLVSALERTLRSDINPPMQDGPNVLDQQLQTQLPVAPGPPAFTIGTEFNGTSLDDLFTLGSALIPPDTMGAVGPSRIAELINGSFSVYDKSGALQGVRSTHAQFWDAAFANSGRALTSVSPFDPRILYDPDTSKWFAVAVDTRNSANSRYLVGHTIGSDPSLANWRANVIDADALGTRWADFPTVGIDADGLYIAANMFDVSGVGVVEPLDISIVSIPKSDLIVNANVATKTSFELEGQGRGFSLQPAVDFSGVSDGEAEILAVNFNFLSNLNRTDITTPAGVPALSATTVFATGLATSSPPLANQPGPRPDNINTTDSRFGGNVVHVDIGRTNPSLWAVHSNGNGSTGNRLHWYEIDSETNAILQEGYIDDTVTNLDLYFPSIAVNTDGDVVIGFSCSNDTTSISSCVVVGKTDSGVTTFSPVTITEMGVGSYQILDGSNRNRWGDYSATVVDPSDPKAFWTFQQMANGTNGADGGNFDDYVMRTTQINIVVPEPSAFVFLGLLSGVFGCGTLTRRIFFSRSIELVA